MGEGGGDAAEGAKAGVAVGDDGEVEVLIGLRLVGADDDVGNPSPAHFLKEPLDDGAAVGKLNEALFPPAKPRGFAARQDGGGDMGGGGLWPWLGRHCCVTGGLV